MIKKLFEVKFLHLHPEFSGQIGTAIFPKSPVEPEVFSSQTFRQSFQKQLPNEAGEKRSLLALLFQCK